MFLNGRPLLDLQLAEVVDNRVSLLLGLGYLVVGLVAGTFVELVALLIEAVQLGGQGGVLRLGIGQGLFQRLILFADLLALFDQVANHGV